MFGDLGLGLARLITFQGQGDKFMKESRANRLRGGSIGAFVLGSAVGSWFFIKLGYRGFILYGAIASYAAWHGRKMKISVHKHHILTE